MGRMKTTKRIIACMLAILLACSSIPMESFRVMAATEDIPNIPAGAEVLLDFGVFGENNEFTWEFYGGTNRLHITGEGDMPDFPYCAPEPIIPPDFDSNDVFLSDADDDLLPDMEIGAYPDEEPVNGNELSDARSTSERAYMDVRPWTSVSAEVKIIDISEGITHISNAAFQDCKKLETVHMPVSVQSIGAGAFCGCESLKSLTFGGALETIKEEAFRLSGLTEIHFQGNAPQMGTDVFGDVTATIYYTAEDDSWQNLVGNNYGGTLDWQPTELIDSGTFGDGFTWAFYKGMDRLYINGTGDMPDFAFCDPYTDFEIPDADKEAFLSDSDDELLQKMDIGAYLDMNAADGTKLADGQNTKENMNNDDRPWASVSSQVKEIYLGENITSIGSGAFQEFKQLERVYMPSVTSVGRGAFCRCESLKTLTFGRELKEIGEEAFYQSGLSEIHFQGSAPQIGVDAFYHVTATVYYPASDAASWQSLVGQSFSGTLNWQPVTDMKDCTVELSKNSFFYDGEAKEPEVIAVRCGNNVLEKNTDYVIKYENQYHAGTAHVVIKGLDTYAGMLVNEYTIQKAETAISYPQAEVSVKTNYDSFVNPLQYDGEDGVITYDSSNPEVAEITYTGEVTVHDVGTTVITATVTGQADYLDGTASYTLHVSEADGVGDIAGGRFGEDLELTWIFYDSGRLVISGTGKIPDYQYCPPISDMPPIPDDDNLPSTPSISGGDDDPYNPNRPVGDEDVPSPPISGGDDDPYNPNQPVCDAQETGSDVENNTFKENLNYSRPWEKYILRIKTLEVAEGITKIGKNSFVDAAALAEVSLPESLADISDYAFANCKSLTNITISSGVCSIGHWAFGLAGLKTIYFAGDAPDINGKAFHEVTADAYYSNSSSGWEEITGQDFGGNLTWHSTDQKKDLSSCSAELSQSEYTYDGTEKKPDVTVKDKNKELKKGTDYTIKYSDNIEVGTATVTIVGKGNYEGTISKTFTIVQANAQGTNVSWLDASLEYMECVYDGTVKEPVVTLKNGSDTLENGVDYTVVYSNNIEPGTASVKICGIGAYTGTGNLKFKITKRKPSLKFSKNSLVKTYGDQAFINQLTQETDGDITYGSSNSDVASVDKNGKVNIKNAGSTVITVTAAEGKYYQPASESYSLEVQKKKAALSFKAKSLTKAYGTSAFTNKLSKVTDGKISFKSSNSQVATVNKTGKVTIKGVGKTKITASAAEGKNYSAKSVSYTLKVNPKGTSILKITSTKKGFTVKWKEQRKQTTGYQVQYAANSKFSGAKNVTLKNTTVSKKISKLKAKKKYFIRVRTYKTVSGEKYVSSWSKTKSVTTRK